MIAVTDVNCVGVFTCMADNAFGSHRKETDIILYKTIA